VAEIHVIEHTTEYCGDHSREVLRVHEFPPDTPLSEVYALVGVQRSKHLYHTPWLELPGRQDKATEEVSGD